jgi:hypothetical protein
METREVKIDVRNSYGVDRYYPVCVTGKLFLSLMNGKKTFSKRDMKTMVQLGFTIVRTESEIEGITS